MATAKVSAAPAAAVGGADPWYAKFDGVDGESTQRDHIGWSDVLSVSQSIFQPEAGASGATRSRASAVLEDIVVAKEVDKATPKLMEAAAKGKVFPKVEIHGTATYGEAGEQVYLAIELEDCRITSYSFSGSTGGVPVESLSLNFEAIKVIYTEYGEDGSKEGDVEFEWKVEKGAK